MRRGNRVMRTGPIDDRHVVAFHPGGAAFPSLPRLTQAERLAAYERELLDAAIERHLYGSGRLAGLAVQIITLRAADAAS